MVAATPKTPIASSVGRAAPYAPRSARFRRKILKCLTAPRSAGKTALDQKRARSLTLSAVRCEAWTRA